jgi:hypothetical protein
VYHRLSEAEHGWNYTRQQLDLARKAMDTGTHVIVHLEHAIKIQVLVMCPRGNHNNSD